VPIGEDKKPRPGPDAVYVVPDVERPSLDIAKNILVHFFVSRALIATPLLAASMPGSDGAVEGALDPARLGERVQALSRLFKYEFQFRADATFETIFAETLWAMEADGEVVKDEAGKVRLAPDGEGRERAILHHRIIRSFV